MTIKERASRQERFEDNPDGLGSVSYLVDWVYRSHLVEPTFSTDTREYDDFLYDISLSEPHLIGVISQVISKDTNRAWYLTGGNRTVRKFAERLHNVEGGEGWRYFVAEQARAFYTANIGAITEIETATGRVGDELMSLYHVDPTVVRLLDSWETPLRYYPRRGRVQDWRRGEYFRSVSLPESREKWRGVGFSAVNRCLSLTKMLVAIYEHDLEQLGAQPPRGFVVGDNITQSMYDEAKRERRRAKENGELEFDVMVLLGGSSNVSTDLRFIPYSSLPVNFDLEQFTYLIMLGYALAFGYDAQEFYPIKGGSFGRGAEAEIQATKTTYKGEADFSLQFQQHIQGVLPANLMFEFDRNDVKGDLLVLQRDKALIDNVNALAYPPNRQLGEMGAISNQEAREMLAERGVIPPEFLETDAPTMQEDTDPETETDQEDTPIEVQDTDPTERLRLHYRDMDRLVRQSEMYPDEPIVRLAYDPKVGVMRSKTLWQRGGDLRDSHRNWRGYSLPPTPTQKRASGVFHDPFLAYAAGHDPKCDCGTCAVAYTPRNLERFAGLEYKRRAEDGDVIVEDGDVLITTGDVDLAIQEAYEVNQQFGELLEAQEVVRVANLNLRAFTWNETARRYQYDNGQFVSAARVREMATESLDNSIDRVAAIAEQGLAPADFQLIAREEIKREYIRQVVAGRGGRDQMTQADWGRVGSLLKKQYKYLDNFATDIENNNLTVGQIQTRLQMYINSAANAYWAGQMASLGIPFDQLPAMPADGSTICLTNCRCFWDYKPIQEDGVVVGYSFTWRLTATNNCETCLTRATSWVKIEIRYSDLIGS